MTKNPDIENALSDVARETGKPLHVVDRVFELIVEVARHDATLLMVEGKLIAAIQPENDGYGLPPSLMTEINESYDDLVELSELVYRACRRAATGMVE
jgi:hypothetical protein